MDCCYIVLLLTVVLSCQFSYSLLVNYCFVLMGTCLMINWSNLQVFDCWFESGAMPYAYIHYPFENTDLFEHNFPGDFVAEGLDQTRGW